MSLLRGVAAGLAAGAAGTTALNAVTYLDMAVRGRSTSSAPEDVAETLAAKAGVDIPGQEDIRSNRLAGLGPLTGIVAGLGVGSVLGAATALGFRPSILVGGALAGAAAMTATDVPMTLLGISDPPTWVLQDWIADAVPHLVYGLVTAAVVTSLDHRARPF